MPITTFTRTVTVLLATLPVWVAASPNTPRPADWISHLVPLEDTRAGHRTPDNCKLEVVELKYESTRPSVGSVLLLPGLLHDSFLFDLIPESGISYARYLMREKALHVYMFHTRGTGLSCYPKFSNLDDIVIDDIPTALRFVAKQAGEPIYVYGHSQGGITLQASLAGLSRCDGGENCFRISAALERQSYVRGALFMGANVAMTSDKKVHPLLGVALLDDVLAAPTSPVVDEIPASLLTEGLSPIDGKGPLNGDRSVAYWNLWEGVYHIPNVSHEARGAFYDRALDSTRLGVLRQYAHGIKHAGIVSTGEDSYADALPLIRVPAAVGVFELDKLAEPGTTERDDYARLGSADKKFFFFPGEGHEDAFMNAEIHTHQSDMWDWMLRK